MCNLLYLLPRFLLLQAKDTITATLQLAGSSVQNLKVKVTFSEVKFQNVLHYYKFKGKQTDGYAKPMQNKLK